MSYNTSINQYNQINVCDSATTYCNLNFTFSLCMIFCINLHSMFQDVSAPSLTMTTFPENVSDTQLTTPLSATLVKPATGLGATGRGLQRNREKPSYRASALHPPAIDCLFPADVPLWLAKFHLMEAGNQLGSQSQQKRQPSGLTRDQRAMGLRAQRPACRCVRKERYIYKKKTLHKISWGWGTAVSQPTNKARDTNSKQHVWNV